MTVSVRLSARQYRLLRSAARRRGLTVSLLLRRAALSLAADELDRRTARSALANYRRDPTAFTLDQVDRILNGSF